MTRHPAWFVKFVGTHVRRGAPHRGRAFLDCDSGVDAGRIRFQAEVIRCGVHEARVRALEVVSADAPRASGHGVGEDIVAHDAPLLVVVILRPPITQAVAILKDSIVVNTIVVGRRVETDTAVGVVPRDVVVDEEIT